ncbi:phospholipase D-like domain-containing protein [Aequorivita flava]|uniref:Phospholipase D-like domain-containing protein n=1 Tax=Aequorivita flava TaxID=3114371 RepID=A0AB35YTS2_9FLAO
MRRKILFSQPALNYRFTLLFLLALTFIGCSKKLLITSPLAVTPDYLKQNAFTAKKAFVLKDNDLAFASKIDIIKNAKNELRLVYYIYDLDETTAFMTHALLEKIKADSDFRVKLLVDYQWNYKNLDFFRWMENQQPNGIQQIEVRFYNRPAVSVIKFAEFMTIGCAGDTIGINGKTPNCADEKQRYLNKYNSLLLPEAEAEMSLEAKIFLAGFYSKDPNGLLFATQLGYARELQNLAENSSSTPTMTEDVKENLKKVMKLYWTAKTGNNAERIKAQIQLSIMGLFYGEQLKPFINGLETILPFSLKDLDNSPLMTNPEIDYITDYSHHKLILADNEVAQLGGRNCANAYHMHPNNLEKKYIFMDTDVFMDLDTRGGDIMQKTYDELWNYTTMVATTASIEKHAPIGYLYLINKATKMAEASCPKNLSDLEKQGCALQIFVQLMESGTEGLVAEKQNEWGAKYEKYLQSYQDNYLDKSTNAKQWTQLETLFDSNNGYIQNNTLSNTLHSVNAIPLTNQPMFYVQNVPYNLTILKRGNLKDRKFGSKYDQEIEHGKMIQKLWEDAFQAACAKSNVTNKPVEVIIHQGYFSPTEGVVHEMNKLMNSNICPNVTLKIYTNSIGTTDLTPINFIGRRQMQYLLQKNNEFNTDRFQYYEYNKDRLTQEVIDNFLNQSSVKEEISSFSLHTKVIIFGDAIYIGSANAEFRSYMMDTNNGIFIEDAPELVAAYKKIFEELEAKQIVVEAKQHIKFNDVKQLRAQEERDVAALLERYSVNEQESMANRKAELEFFIRQFYATLDQVTVAMKKSLKKKKLKGPSELDALLKVF